MTMTRLRQLRPLLLRTSRRRCPGQRFAASIASEPPDNDNKTKRPMYIPETPQSMEDIAEPTTCCMSGCANCVWIEYAERLSSALKASQSDVQKLIMDKVQDPNMRAFLSMELRVRKLID